MSMYISIYLSQKKKQTLMRIWENRNPHVCWCALERSPAFPEKVKHRVNPQLSDFAPGHVPKRTENMSTQKFIAP